MSTTERDDAPWTWTGDRFENHYGSSTHSAGWAPERMEAEAALDWVANGNPQDGDRWGEYFVRDGQLWNDGRYGAADGSAEPYAVWGAATQAADDGHAR